MCRSNSWRGHITTGPNCCFCFCTGRGAKLEAFGFHLFSPYSRTLDHLATAPPKVGSRFLFKSLPGQGGEPGIFCFRFIFSPLSSALNHSATAPPYRIQLFVLFRYYLVVANFGTWSTLGPIITDGLNFENQFSLKTNVFGKKCWWH